MKITIDTNQDSKSEIIEVIKLLKKFISDKEEDIKEDDVEPQMNDFFKSNMTVNDKDDLETENDESDDVGLDKVMPY